MFLHLDWSPPVVNSIDWTWFGKAHTCLYKVSQLTMHIRAKTKPWGWRNCLQSSERSGLCRGTDLGKATKRNLLHWRFQEHMASIMLQWKKFGPEQPETLLKPQPSSGFSNWAIAREGPWVREVVTEHYPDSPWLSSRDPVVGDGRNFQKDNHHCNTQHWSGLDGRDSEGSLSSVKDTWKPVCGVCTKKAPKGLLDCEKQDSLVWWNQDWTVWPQF